MMTMSLIGIVIGVFGWSQKCHAFTQSIFITSYLQDSTETLDDLLNQADSLSGTLDESVIDPSFWDIALGGGSPGFRKKDVCPDGDYSPDPYDGLCGSAPQASSPMLGSAPLPIETGAQIHSGATEGIVRAASTTGFLQKKNITYSYYSTGICADRESFSGYLFGFANHITNAMSCPKARLSALMTRSQVADMVSRFALNVLDKKPDTTKKCLFDDVKYQTTSMKASMNAACQLGVMGVNNINRSPASSFHPNEIVTKAQFATILSRLLYGDKYNSKDMCRYCRHVAALRRAGIVTKSFDLFDPLRIGVALLMFMRAG